jgi:glutaredoxin
MNPLARSLLQCFEGLGRDSLELAALAQRAGLAPDSVALRAAVDELLRGGLLRAGESRDSFARTEDGRLALAGPREVTLYTRPGCHLCDEAKFAMAPLLREFGARLREVNVDLDPALHARYTNDVPVVFLGSRKVAKHRLDPRQFRRQLESAAS